MSTQESSSTNSTSTTTTTTSTTTTTTTTTTPSTTTSTTTPSTTTNTTTNSTSPNLAACKPHCVRAQCNVQEAMFIRYYCSKECLWLYTYQAQIYSASSVLPVLSTGSISSSLTINATQLQCSGTTPPTGLNVQGCQSHCITAQTDMAEAIFVKGSCANECLWFYGCSAQAAQGQPACGDNMLGRISAQATVLCRLVTSFCTDIAYSSAYIKARCGRTCGLC
ncbi:hypothetical protein Ddc_15853 [Ditylenchus destructor]|nr:hypothetical protein Ddc_15853 [Ditylenchus destructor]